MSVPEPQSWPPPAYDHWIAGAAQPPVGGLRLESRSPVDGALVTRIADGDTDDVSRAAGAAEAAQPGWAALKVSDRGRVLASIAAALRAEADLLVALEIAETGKLRAKAAAEVELAAEYFDFYGSVVRALHGENLGLGPDQHAFTVREPFGVVGIITPWNAPITQAARGVAPALAMGNAVIVKPSEFTSTTTLELARIAGDAGLPAGVLNVVTGTGARVGIPLVTERRIGRVSFTGSVATGRRVAVLAAERLIPVTLELGGKSPHLVFADADLELAAQAAARAFTDNAGQLCSSGTRLLVEDAVHDQVVERIVGIVSTARAGHDLAPIITPDQFVKVCDYLDLARQEGAQIVTGGRPAAGTGGQYVLPTILTGVTADMRVAREEIFGPVLCVLPFADEAHAVALANDSDFGLVSGVWTGDVHRALRVAARLQTGQVYVNQWNSAHIEVPFGGFKASGYGREKGVEALHEYSRLKSVVMHVSESPGH